MRQCADKTRSPIQGAAKTLTFVLKGENQADVVQVRTTSDYPGCVHRNDSTSLRSPFHNDRGANKMLGVKRQTIHHQLGHFKP